MEVACERCHQCRRKYVPLILSYARTIHKFQGLTAGPVDEGKIKNMYSTIICDPGDRSAEGRAPGLFYTAVSRATTLGNPDGTESAIYFTGDDFKEERIRNVSTKKDSVYDYEKVRKRNIWTRRLKQNTKSHNYLNSMRRALTWAKTRRYTWPILQERIESYVKCKRSPPSRKRKKQ